MPFPSADVNYQLSNNTNDSSHTGQEIKIIYIIGIALLIIRIIVPILLIIMGMVGLVKAMTQNDDRDIKKEIMKLIPKVIAAIIIFILPALVALLMKLVGNNSIWSTYSKCLLRPTTCNVDLWSK